jgi:hypothetical protein
MDLFNRVKTTLKENRQNRLDGKVNCIPWIDMKKLSSVIPGIERGKYWIVTGASKSAKSQITDHLFVNQPFKYYLKQKQEGGTLKLKIFYFSLEMTAPAKILQNISNRLYHEFNIIKSPVELKSVYENYILEEDILNKINTLDPFFDEFGKVITYITSVGNPFGIYSYMRNYAETNGYFVDKNGVELDMNLIKKNDEETTFKIDRYIPHDPEEYVIVITDHLKLLKTEKGNSLYQAINDHSSRYSVRLRNRFNYIVVDVQQQTPLQEQQQFYQGQSILDKLKPTMDGLDSNKSTGQNVDYLLGIFAPSRYKVDEYQGYNISQDGNGFRDRYRELSLIFSRDGRGNIADDLFFNGATNFFCEIETPEEFRRNPSLYQKYKIM